MRDGVAPGVIDTDASLLSMYSVGTCFQLSLAVITCIGVCVYMSLDLPSVVPGLSVWNTVMEQVKGHLCPWKMGEPGDKATCTIHVYIHVHVCAYIYCTCTYMYVYLHYTCTCILLFCTARVLIMCSVCVYIHTYAGVNNAIMHVHVCTCVRNVTLPMSSIACPTVCTCTCISHVHVLYIRCV